MARSFHCPKCGSVEITKHQKYVECNKCGAYGTFQRFRYYSYEGKEPSNREGLRIGTGTYRRKTGLEDNEPV